MLEADAAALNSLPQDMRYTMNASERSRSAGAHEEQDGPARSRGNSSSSSDRSWTSNSNSDIERQLPLPPFERPAPRNSGQQPPSDDDGNEWGPDGGQWVEVTIPVKSWRKGDLLFGRTNLQDLTRGMFLELYTTAQAEEIQAEEAMGRFARSSLPRTFVRYHIRERDGKFPIYPSRAARIGREFVAQFGDLRICDPPEVGGIRGDILQRLRSTRWEPLVTPSLEKLTRRSERLAYMAAQRAEERSAHAAT